MTDKPKTGRPRKTEQAKQSLAHRVILESACEQLALLADRMIDGGVGEEALIAELKEIAYYSGGIEFSPTDRERRIFTPNTERLELLARLGNLRNREMAFEIIAECVARMVDAAKHDTADVLLQLKRSITHQPAVSSYQHTLLEKLAAAGVTKHNAAQITVEELEALLTKSGSRPRRTRSSAAAETPSKAERSIEFANDDAPLDRSPWRQFLLSEQKRYAITEKPLNSINNRATAVILDTIDYPPFISLEEYEQPELFAQFEAATYSREKTEYVEGDLQSLDCCHIW